MHDPRTTGGGHRNGSRHEPDRVIDGALSALLVRYFVTIGVPD